MSTTTNKQWLALLDKHRFCKAAFAKIPKEVIETDAGLLMVAFKANNQLISEFPLAMRTKEMAQLLIGRWDVELALKHVPADQWDAAMYDRAMDQSVFECLKYMPETEKTFTRCERAFRHTEDMTLILNALPESVVISCSDRDCKGLCSHDYCVVSYTGCGQKWISCKHSEAIEKVAQIHSCQITGCRATKKN